MRLASFRLLSRLLVIASLLLITTKALADEPARPSIRMRYHEVKSPAACSGETLLREELRMRMGYDPFRDDADDELTVSVALRGDHLVADIEARNAAGEIFSHRSFEVPNSACGCLRLISHVASSIEFTLTPIVTSEQEPAPPPVCPEPAPRRTVPPSFWDTPPPPRPPPQAARAAEPAWKPAEIGVGALGGLGTAEEAFAGGYGLFRLRWPDLSLAVEFRLRRIASRERAILEAPRQEAASLLFTELIVVGWRRTRGILAGAFVPCVHSRHLFGCGVLEAGTLTISERRPEDPTPPRRPVPSLLLIGAGLRAGAELPVGSALSFHVFTELLTALLPLKAELTEAETTLTSGLTANLGAGVLFGF